MAGDEYILFCDDRENFFIKEFDTIDPFKARQYRAYLAALNPSLDAAYETVFLERAPQKGNPKLHTRHFMGLVAKDYDSMSLELFDIPVMDINFPDYSIAGPTTRSDMDLRLYAALCSCTRLLRCEARAHEQGDTNVPAPDYRHMTTSLMGSMLDGAALQTKNMHDSLRLHFWPEHYGIKSFEPSLESLTQTIDNMRHAHTNAETHQEMAREDSDAILRRARAISLAPIDSQASQREMFYRTIERRVTDLWR